MTPELVRTASSAVAGPGTLAYDCPIPHVPEAVSLVRHRVQALLTGWGTRAGAVDEAVLVVSELVTNAVVHALPPARLVVSMPSGRRIRVEVRDQGPAHTDGPRLSDDEHGRGCDIVSVLAAASGAYEDAGEAVRWAELDC